MRVLILAAALIPFAMRAEAAELALRRVMLSSAGVGYYEYEAEVDGAAMLGLDVRLDQVDDVLKSLVVFDAAGGVGGIELPGRDGARAAFGAVPFGPEGLGSPLAYLNSLQGVEVAVQGPRAMTGRILRAETAPVLRAGSAPNVAPNAAPGAEPAQDRTRVTLLTTEGLRQFVLEEADAVQVVDPALRDRIGAALASLRRDTARDARRITLRTLGTGRRTVRVGYVAGAPLWKASYRLVLPAPGGPGTARLQGWATLENMTGTDWSGVALSLQYGNPVTFRQAIYRSYFVERPEVPVEVLGRLLPDVDTRARALPPPPPAPAPAPAMAPRAMRMMQEAAPAPVPMAAMAEPVAAQEGAEETLFAIAAPVTLGAGHSASVPILDAEVPAARVALLRPGQAHPLSAVQVENATPTSLPAGVLTLYDAAGSAPYAGDARLGGVPAGETRLIAFAQDLRTTATWRNEDRVTVASLTAADGVLTVEQRNRQVTHVTLTAPAAMAGTELRRVLVEVDKAPGTVPAPGFAQPASETGAAWRFPVELGAGAVLELTYALDRSERRSITLLDDDEAVLAVLNQQGTTPAARAALERIAALRRQESARVAERDRLVTQRAAVEADEERLRANLAAVPANDALRGRLVRQLDADETRLAQLAPAIDAAEAAVAAAGKALRDGIAGLRL